MKTILVQVGGGDTDQTVFETALQAARPFSAHLAFFHVRIDAGEAALWTPHAEFAQGPALRDCLDRLRSRAQARAVAAKRHVEAFCAERRLDIADMPRASAGVTASWREEEHDATQRLMLRARHHDLVVVGRARGPDGLPPDLLEQLLLGCGRPLLIASSRPPRTLAGTIVVCWKEAPEAARAVTAAMPLLRMADRVVVVGVDDGPASSEEAVADLARQLLWHGIAGEARFLSAGSTVQETLFAAARSYGADLLVLGGYSRSRAREMIFGGVTRSVLEGADLPVFVLH